VEEVSGYENLRQATHCSLGFFFVSVATNSVQNVESLAMESEGFDKLGYFELAILYLMLGLGSLIATPALYKVGPKICMMIGSSMNFIWILGSILPASKVINGNNEETGAYSDGLIYFISIITSALVGVGEAL
jgi:hypothetical protein